MVRPFPGRRVLMPIFILPLFMSPVVVGQFWNLLLTRPFGPTDYLLGKLVGHEVTIDWTTQAPWDYISIILADTWQWTPFMFVIILAGLSAIPDELYEAADLDGAKPMRAFFFVTLPLLAPIIVLAVTFRLLDAVKLFDVIYVLTGGGPANATHLMATYAYSVGMNSGQMGMGSAAALAMVPVLGVVLLLMSSYVRRS
jgi:multiple sugar transport system permease protein